MKPLSPGEHTIFYNVRLIPTDLLTSPGTNPYFADVTYTLHVRQQRNTLVENTHGWQATSEETYSETPSPDALNVQ